MADYKVNISEDKCVGCGECVQICPKQILYIDEDRNVCKITDESKCDGLRGCERACPEDAIKISKNSNGKEPVKGKKKMIIRAIAGILIGGVVGAGIGYSLKCAGGICPLTCNPRGGAITGAIIGFISTFIY